MIDLADTSFLDCAGLTALAATREALRTEDRALVLRGAQGVVRRAVGLSNLADLLHDTPEHTPPRGTVIADAAPGARVTDLTSPFRE